MTCPQHPAMVPLTKQEVWSCFSGTVLKLYPLSITACVGKSAAALDLDEEILYWVRIAWHKPVSRFPDGPEPTYGDF